MNPLISVIVPIYNVEKYINRCIDSILNQTYTTLEIILVDDGSPDNCPEICNKYAEIDSRIKVIHKKNGGAAAARNIGLQVAKGDYISFIDSDDYIEHDMYSSMIEKAIKHNCDLVISDFKKVFANGKKQLVTHGIREGFYNKEQLYKEYFHLLLMKDSIEYPPTVSNWICLFKKSLVDEKSLKYHNDVIISEDLLFGSQLMYFVSNFYYLNKPYYNYYSNPNSVSNKFYEDKWENFMILYEEIEKFFLNKTDYNFKHQVSYCLLFFVFNSIANIYNSNYSIFDKYKRILIILQNYKVKKLFEDIDIEKLNVTKRMKTVAKIFKYRVGILPLIIYYSKKKIRSLM